MDLESARKKVVACLRHCENEREREFRRLKDDDPFSSAPVETIHQPLPLPPPPRLLAAAKLSTEKWLKGEDHTKGRDHRERRVMTRISFSERVK